MIIAGRCMSNSITHKFERQSQQLGREGRSCMGYATRNNTTHKLERESQQLEKGGESCMEKNDNITHLRQKLVLHAVKNFQQFCKDSVFSVLDDLASL